MLREALSIADDERFDEPAYAAAGAWAGATPAAFSFTYSTSRYGERRGINRTALIVTVGAHLLLLAFALFYVGHRHHRRHHDDLVVLNLKLAPPPPPNAPAPPEPQQKPPVVAPVPVLQTNVPPVVALQTAPEPSPQPAVATPVVSSAPSPPAPPAPPPAVPPIVQASDLAAKMIAGKPPSYPFDSRRKHEQGTVVLALTLGLDGSVADIVLARSSGFSRLDKAAMDAVRRWRWQPTTRGGQAVIVKGIVEIPFVLQG